MIVEVVQYQKFYWLFMSVAGKWFPSPPIYDNIQFAAFQDLWEEVCLKEFCDKTLQKCKYKKVGPSL